MDRREYRFIQKQFTEKLKSMWKTPTAIEASFNEGVLVCKAILAMVFHKFRWPCIPVEFNPTKSELDRWEKELPELHKRGDLDSTIKELAVICRYYEHNGVTTWHKFQAECFRRALGYLVLLKEII